MKKIQVYLTERQQKYIGRLVKSKGIKVADAVRRMLDEFLDLKETRKR